MFDDSSYIKSVLCIFKLAKKISNTQETVLKLPTFSDDDYFIDFFEFLEVNPNATDDEINEKLWRKTNDKNCDIRTWLLALNYLKRRKKEYDQLYKSYINELNDDFLTSPNRSVTSYADSFNVAFKRNFPLVEIVSFIKSIVENNEKINPNLNLPTGILIREVFKELFKRVVTNNKLTVTVEDLVGSVYYSGIINEKCRKDVASTIYDTWCNQAKYVPVPQKTIQNVLELNLTEN